MKNKNRGYMNDVDSLIEQTPLVSILRHYGKDEPRNTSGEHRMQCVFDQQCVDSTYGQLAVNQDSPAKVIYCHTCGVRGNLLTLIHGLETNTPPTGGRVKGQEFKAAVGILRQIDGGAGSTPSSPASHVPAAAIAAKEQVQQVQFNRPMRLNEKTRPLENLYEDLVSDPAVMPPNPAAYFRKRQSWLTPEVAAKWRMGYLPKNGRSMYRSSVVYAQHDPSGQVIGYSSRTMAFEQKWQEWIQSGRNEKTRPTKHRYPKGYQRGLELYGQMASRLDDEHVRRSLSERGLIVVEGANDVIRLDCLGAAAVGLCSNQATDEQIKKIAQFSVGHARGHVVLMADNDAEGMKGFKELPWKLMERGLSVQLAWSPTMHNGVYADMEPEDITPTQWNDIAGHLAKS
ncbi:toprim domain-containing protein [bacterium]|nr:toprim domain-containing protein [bacterium]